MKKQSLLSLALCSLMLLSACKKADKEDPQPAAEFHESKYLRLFVSDQDLKDYYLINPKTASVETQTGEYANGSVYQSPSGRFASVINTSNNLVSFFDSGIEEHGTHVHIKGTPKWCLTKATGTTPVHYYGRGEDMLVFNDGDGSISHATEATLHTESTARTFSAGVAHHGAPALFNNSTIAVTEKDGSVSGTLPERVKVIDMDGATLHASTIQTEGIHGEAGNGELVLFGSTDGILKVNKDGTQELIAYPSSFGSNWLGTIYYGKGAQQFIGFKSKYGIYKIDPSAGTVTVIEENAALFSATFDWEGNNLVLIYTNGLVKVLDGVTMNVVSSKLLAVSFPATGSIGNPVAASSKKYVYITDGMNGKINVYQKSNLAQVKEITLPGKPSKIALIGSLVEEDDDH
ncbi:MAG: hypothetical protein K0R51_1997 [Cytophagaceae bacterium]|jgi:hypothetical protein|nr:hypothetical protein [Cytophagaceae bacterium]